MARPTLRPVKQTKAPAGPTLSQIKEALRKWKAPYIAKALYRANAVKWLKARAALGDKHILHSAKPPVTWGQPGDHVASVFAPRRQGERA